MDTSEADELRFLDWCETIPGYEFADKNKKKKLKRKYMEERKCSFVPIATGTVSTEYHERTMYDCEPYCRKETEKQETTMYYADYTKDENKVYLLTRLASAKNAKEEEASTFFALFDDSSPRTAKDLVDRITAGKFVLPTELEERDGYTGNLFCIQWRDPSKKMDRDGYNKFLMDKLRPAVTDTKDAIMLKTPDEGLAAIKTLETMAIP